MQNYKLKSGLELSKIILGTWAIGGYCWGKYEQDKASQAIETALDNGLNTIDTAPVYGNGQAEELIGKIIKNKREKVVLATKCGLDFKNNYIVNLSVKFIQQDLENSLKRLQTDHIDLYQCHWPDVNHPIEKTMAGLLKLQQQGKIRYIGISNFNNEQILEALKYAPLATLQPQYSLVERSIEKDIQETCLKNNIGIIPYAPLGAGILTGKYKEWPQFDKDDARSFFYKFFQKKYWPKVQLLVNKLREIAEQKNSTPGNIALAWVLAQPAVAGVIAGAKNPEQVLENIKATEINLSTEELAALSDLSREIYQ